jgi:hypothetical protein
MIIARGRATSGYTWNVYHRSLGAGGLMVLNRTDTFASNTGVWQNTAPTNSVIFGNSTNWGGAEPYVIYSWAEVPGYSKFGSYTGNANNSGPFINCGFKPRWIMIKRTDATNNWTIIDTARYPANTSGPDNPLRPNTNEAETGGSDRFALGDILSNGFKLRYFDSSTNASGGTYIYAAFAEMPFRYGLAR